MNHALLIETRDLVKTYSLGESAIRALDKVSLRFETAEFTGLVGPSGSGKTTLLNIVGSLDSPTAGSAVVMGRKVEDLSHREAAAASNTDGAGAARSRAIWSPVAAAEHARTTGRAGRLRP